MRVSVEWAFKDIKKILTSFDYGGQLKLRKGPVGMLYLFGAFSWNLRSCLYGSQTPRFFIALSPLSTSTWASHDLSIRVGGSVCGICNCTCFLRAGPRPPTTSPRYCPAVAGSGRLEVGPSNSQVRFLPAGPLSLQPATATGSRQAAPAYIRGGDGGQGDDGEDKAPLNRKISPHLHVQPHCCIGTHRRFTAAKPSAPSPTVMRSAISLNRRRRGWPPPPGRSPRETPQSRRHAGAHVLRPEGRQKEASPPPPCH